jgi:hypothetical protein
MHVGRSRVRFPMVSLEFFIDNPSGRTMALESSQLQTEMSTRNVFWLVNTSRLSCGNCLEICKLHPPGNLWTCNKPAQGLHAICLLILGLRSLNMRRPKIFISKRYSKQEICQ